MLALAEAGRAATPAIVTACRMLLNDLQLSQWGVTSDGPVAAPTSWMLFDASQALVAVRKSFPAEIDAIWTRGRLVLAHPRSRGRINRFLMEQWVALTSALIVALTILALRRADLLKEFTLKSILIAIGTILLGVAANFIFEWIRGTPRIRGTGVKA
jgi:hypothetical protein